MGRRPNLFIIGAPKSGTTSLYEYIEGHPDVYMSPVKEPQYFAPDMAGEDRVAYRFGRDDARYLALFAGASDERLVGEASTRYLASHEAPRLIRDFERGARIVAILRDPVEMLYSLHGEFVSDGNEDIVDFETALAADTERLAGRHLRRGVSGLWSAYRPKALYAEHLERWYDAFPHEQVHIMVFDDLVADTAGEFRKVLEFAGVDAAYQPSSFAARRQSHRRRPGVRALTRNRLAQGVARSILPRLLGEPRARRLLWRFRQSRLNRRPFERPPLATDLRRQLEDELRPDVRRLSALLGRDLESLWFGRPASA